MTLTLRRILLVGFLSAFLGCVPRQDVPPPTDSGNAASDDDSYGSDDGDATVSSESQFETLPVAKLAKPQSAINDDPRDWRYWRGPEWNGQSRETGLVDDFDPNGGEGSNVKWKAEVGGISTPVLMDGLIYTLVQAIPEHPARDGEKVVCLNAETGEPVWENRFNVYLSDVPDTRVGWSSVYADADSGNIYAQGVCGLLSCIDAKTGETKWQVPMHERFGLLSTYGGRTNYPVVVDDLVICSAVVIGWGEMAKPAHRFIAFDKHSGDVVWFNGTRDLPYDTTYSGPTVSVINGQKLMIFGSGDGAVWAFKPRTGEQVWQYKMSRRGLNAPPLVVGSTVYAGHSEENVSGTTAMGALASIDATKTGDLTETGRNWQVPEVMAGRTQPLLIDGNLWVVDDRAKLWIYNAETGEQVGNRVALGTMMRSSPLYADGKVYACTANGRWYILVPDARRGAKISKKGRFPSGEGTVGSPIASRGRVYIQTTGGLYCLEDSSKEHGFTGLPAAAKEVDVAADQKPAHLQIVPAEVLMRPDETQHFTARLFNSHGQLLKTVAAEFSVDGPGKISSDGAFSVGSDGAHKAAYVTATADGLTGQARVRIVPPLPWKFDFNAISIDATKGSGEPPITWVGCRYRHVIRNEDGENVMVKITTIPKGTRSRCWMGHSDFHDYTMQADVRGSIVDNKMPDIGLIAQGYTLDLKGESQQLQIRSWVTQERMARNLDFPWKPETWYTMKFTVANVGDKVVLKGKVWPRGTAEPSNWMLEATDDVPVRTGSPGLYGNAKDAEIWLDNITVVPNS
ncbi:MAG: PQQ-like beta-propeller repeat protein [Planctomycetales bacterium]|nr:PQQ-like beta-propeller repeat protein [Planctomycetales bacterium]